MTPEQDLFDRLKGAQGIKPTAPSEGSAAEAELIKTDPDHSTPVGIRNIFIHHDTHPVVIDFALLKSFGPTWMGWDSATIYAEIQKTFSSQISEHARAKIQAIKTIHITDGVWTSWQIFEKIIQALNNNIPKWELMQAPSLEQLYAGIDILGAIRQEEFSNEVKLYMAAAVLNEDVFYVPPPLDFIQTEVSQPKFVCKDCGNSDSALFHDGLCSTCTHKFDEENGLSFRPDPDAIAAGRGKNLEVVLTYDPDPIEKRWLEVEHKPSAEADLQENQTDIQVAKLLIARDYMNIRRRQLVEQLIALKSWLGSV